MPTYDEVMQAARKADAAGNAADAKRLLEIAKSLSKPIMIDTKSGAPKAVRALVGGAPEKGRLSTLRQFYPDARPDIVDPSNFVFTNPDTGRPTLYNPQGLDLGDVPSVGREAASYVGSGLGAAAGTAIGLPAGPVAGWAMGGAGAGVGGPLFEEGFDTVAKQFGMQDPRPAAEQQLDTLASGVIFGGGQLLGSGLPGFAKAGLRGGARREAMQETIDEFKKAGVTPTVGQATGSHAYQVAETVLSNLPGGSGVIAKKAEETLKGFETTVRQTARDLSPTGMIESAEDVGLRITTGFDTWSDQFYAQGRQMERNWRNMLPGSNSGEGGPTVFPGQTLGYLGRDFIKYGDYESTQVLGSGTLQNLLKGITNDALRSPSGDIPMDVLLTIRTQVGNRLSRFNFADDTSRKELRSLYEALTSDIRGALPPHALGAFDETKAFWAQGFQRVDNFLANLQRKGVEPENLFKALETGGKEGATKLRTVRSSVSTDDWKMFVAATLDRMGRPTPGERSYSNTFSIGTYLKNWGNLSEEAKEAMFGGLPGYGMLRRDLDTLWKVASRIDESGEVWVNPSGTARVAGGITGAVGVGAAFSGSTVLLEALGKGYAFGWAASKLLTNPRFVHWLARSSMKSPNEFGAHIGALGAAWQSTGDHDLKEAIEVFLTGLRDASSAGQTATAEGN
jgi:hypothetical protein